MKNYCVYNKFSLIFQDDDDDDNHDTRCRVFGVCESEGMENDFDFS